VLVLQLVYVWQDLRVASMSPQGNDERVLQAIPWLSKLNVAIDLVLAMYSNAAYELALVVVQLIKFAEQM
jgi:hypothetical protein